MRNIVLSVIVSFLYMACSSDVEDKSSSESETHSIDDLRTEVIAVHDEAMAKMGHINTLSRQLKGLRDSLEVAGGSEGLVDSLSEAIADLYAADEGMRLWMRNYEPSEAETGKPGAEKYLKNQMEEILQVQGKIDQSIAKGEGLLK